MKAKPNTGQGKLKKRSGRSKKCSRSKLGRLCPEHAGFGTNDAPPFCAPERPGGRQLGARRSVLNRATRNSPTNQPLRRTNPPCCPRLTPKSRLTRLQQFTNNRKTSK